MFLCTNIKTTSLHNSRYLKYLPTKGSRNSAHTRVDPCRGFEYIQDRSVYKVLVEGEDKHFGLALLILFEQSNLHFAHSTGIYQAKLYLIEVKCYSFLYYFFYNQLLTWLL